MINTYTYTIHAADIALAEWNFNLEVLFIQTIFFLRSYSVAGESTSIIFKIYCSGVHIETK